MERMIADGALVTRRVGTGRRARILVDLESTHLPDSSTGTVHVREAARMIGLPVSVLRHLREVGVFPSAHRRGHHSAWHLDDLETFRKRTLALAHIDRPEAGSTICLSELMRLKFRSAAAKADVVAAVLDGRLSIHGQKGESLAGLMLDRAQVEAFILYTRCDAERQSYSMPQCAKVTGLDPSVVESAIAMGLLTAQDCGGRTRVTAASAERFRSEYVPLAALARRLGSHTAGLLRKCRDAGLAVISVPRADHPSPQPLLHRAEKRRLIELWENEVRSRGAQRANAVPSCEERLRRYLDQLRATGQRLPRRAGRPSLSEIARACGINRNAFYVSGPVARMLKEFDVRERAVIPCQAMEKLQDHLRQLE
jgi:hypothetical protein